LRWILVFETACTPRALAPKVPVSHPHPLTPITHWKAAKYEGGALTPPVLDPPVLATKVRVGSVR